MENVVINFTGNTDGLKPVENVLDSIIEKDKEVGVAWSETAKKITKQNKAAQESTTKISKAIDNLAAATKSMDKVVIAGAYRKYLNEIQQALGLTNKEIIAYIQNAKRAAQEAIFSAQDQKEADELTLSIEVMNEQLKKLQESEDSVSAKTESLRSQLRKAKEELVAMAEAGLQGTPAFNELQQKAGELDDQMRDLNATVKGLGSDTKNIDGLISLASGVTSGFAVAQGTMALFGAESEDVQKALLKVNAAMAILQGLQQIQNVLQKESAASLLLQSAATDKTAASTSRLNTIMKTNPVLLLITAIGGLAAILSNLGDEAVDTEKLLERFQSRLDAISDSAKKVGDDIRNNAELEVLALQKAGASKEKILQAELRGKQDALDYETQALGQALDERTKLETERANAILEIEKLVGKGKVKVSKESAEQYQNAWKAANDKVIELQEQVNNSQNDLNKSRLQGEIELQNDLRDSATRSAIAAAEAEVARRKKVITDTQVDSIKSIEAVTAAEINAINVRRNEELKAEKITAGERAKINAEAELQIAELRKKQQQQLLDIQLSGINAQLLLAQKGSDEEYELKVKSLEMQRSIELSATELTQQQANEIRAKYEKEAREIQRSFNEQQLQDNISYLTSALDQYGITEERRLSLTIKRLEKQRALEISQAEENAAKIQEINAKTDREILEARKTAITNRLAEDLRGFDALTNIYITRNQKVLESDKSTFEERRKANGNILRVELDRLSIEEAALKKQKDKKLITQEEYSVKLQEIENKRFAATKLNEENTTKITIQEIEIRVDRIQSAIDVFQRGLFETLGQDSVAVAIAGLQNLGNQALEIIQKVKAGTLEAAEGLKVFAQLAISTIQSIGNQVFADSSARRQQALQDQLAALDEQRQNELDNANLSAQQKADVEQKYREREKQEKRRAFEADKEARKEQAAMNAALAITQAYATNPFPYSLIVSAIIAAATAIQIQRINNTKVPRFKTGEVDIKGPGTGTSDSIPAMISRGESVIKADSTKKWKEALTAINDDRFEEYLSARFRDFVFPTAPDDNLGQQVHNSLDIDYDTLARAIATEMKGAIPAPKSVHVSVDKDGIRTIVQEGDSTYTYKNSKFNLS